MDDDNLIIPNVLDSTTPIMDGITPIIQVGLVWWFGLVVWGVWDIVIFFGFLGFWEIVFFSPPPPLQS